MLIKVNKDKLAKKIIQQAVGILGSGGVLVTPTETAYGLCGDATSRKAIEKIVELKNRPQNKFFPLVVASTQQLQQYFELNKKELDLVEKYPGLSLVLKPKLGTQKRDVYLMPSQKNCAVRISTNNLMRSLAKKLGRPIVATSANIAEGETCYDVGCIKKQISALENKMDLILDGGTLKKRKPSTIVRVEGEEVEVVRQGEVVMEL